MAETVKIPGVGPVKKQTVYVVGGLVVAVGVFGWYRARGKGAAPSATPSSDQTDTSSGDLAPATPEGSYGYGSGGGTSTSSSSSSTGYTTNGAWSQAAEDYLVNTVHSGNSADVIGNALGKYITGQALTSDQVSIVEQAIAFTGYPPVNGPSGYPPSYRTTSSSSSSTEKPGWAHNQKVTSYSSTTATFTWSAASRATGYNILLNGKKVHSTADTTYALNGLKHNTLYTIGIQPYNHYGNGPVSHVQVHTKK